MKKLYVVVSFLLMGSLSACFFGDKDAKVNKPESTNKPKVVIAKKDKNSLTDSEKNVYQELADFAKSHIITSNKNIVPNKRSPKVEKQNNMYVASYVEFDPSSVSLELIPTPHRQYKYMAKVKYRERLFQSKGENLNSALKGEFRVVGSRFITEVPRYNKGKWTY